MAYNHALTDRLRELLAAEGDAITEKKMFGGYSFLYKGKMTIGVMGDNLLVRIVPEKWSAMLEKDGVGKMAFTGRSMKEFVTVAPAAYDSDKALATWAALGLEHARYKLGE